MQQKEIQKLREKIRQQIPQGFLVLRTDEGRHIYEAPSLAIEFESVTTKLGVIHIPWFENVRMNRALEYLWNNHEKITEENKDQLFKEAKEEPQRLFREAGKLGTAVHNAADRYFTHWIESSKNESHLFVSAFLGEEFKENPGALSACKSLENWIKETGYIPLATEIQVWSVKNKIAGTIDDVGVIGNQIVILDLKTSNNIIPNYWLQVAAYHGMFTELTRLQVKKCLILRLNKSYPEAEEQVIKNHRKRYREFLHVVKFQEAIKEIEALQLLSNKNIVTL